MRAFNRWIKLLVVVCCLLLPLANCGDSQRNDQGVSFTFVGWFKEPGTDFATAPGLSAMVIPLSTPGPENWPEMFWGLEPGWAGMLNNLGGEFIRVERAFINYYIPGANIQPPETSVATPYMLGPVPSNLDDSLSTGSTLPDNIATDRGNKGFIQIPIVTPAVRTFIILNKEQLPEPPFVMVVTAYFEGVTSSGNRIHSNSMPLEIFMGPDIEIPPTQGETPGFGEEGGEEAATEEEVAGEVEEASEDGSSDELVEFED